MRIGLILKTLDEEYQFSIYSGARQKALEAGCELVCIHGEDFDNEEGLGTSFFPAGKFLPLDGIILLSAIFSDNLGMNTPVFSGLSEDIPVVTIGSSVQGCIPVFVDSVSALHSLMDHLFQVHGYKRYLYIGGPVTNEDNKVRESVFRQRIDEAALHDSGYSITVRNGRIFSEGEGTQLIQQYIKEHPGKNVDVILAGSDDTAIGIQKYLNSIPYSEWYGCPVTGFDDIPAAGLVRYGLTTVHQPLQQLGEAGVSALCDAVNNGNTEPSTVFSSFIVRGSCGCEWNKDSQNIDRGPMLRSSLQLSRDFGYFGQTLMNLTSVEELNLPLSSFLINIDVPLFYLFMFRSPSREIPDAASLVFSRTPREGDRWFNSDNEVDIIDFFSNNIFTSDITEPYFLFSLRSGTERLGYILYSAKDSVLPFLSFCGVFIANTLKRLQVLEGEKKYAERLEMQVEERTRQLRTEAKRRQAVEAEFLKLSDLERMRFGMDLHDDICQRLAGIMMICKNYSEIHPVMQTLSKMSSQALLQTREYAYSSFPIDIESIGLNKALENLCRDIHEGNDSITCTYSGPENLPLEPCEDIEVNVFRIAREALHNAEKHSGASRIDLSLSCDKGFLHLKVKDNGTGNCELNSEYIPIRNMRRPRGLGLRSMSYRAHQLSAEYRFSSDPETGTCVELRVPLRRRDR